MYMYVSFLQAKFEPNLEDQHTRAAAACKATGDATLFKGRLYTYIHMYICTHTHTYIYIYIYIYIYMCVCVCVYVCIYK